ncbi:rapamycin-insensitive companion of mTOR-like isoform X1 [Histomonas meleagridis]|uniref:rapamycin-insensitive companion of mTOR-like isoform X1 n=1 Tax=Histomonas meleagridis TaxID=135588 RepID=UPI003559BBA7|nr:rapamycin-insensitive companion of mTOR-like isoform X1 [Histomonas meleagridis]KAH0806115.1 rapamycin-insensitive companion of mTOR-like isoform X1 [Histomonas meleagridis]
MMGNHMDSFVAFAIKYLATEKLKQAEIVKIYNCLKYDISFVDMETFPISFVAAYIHKLYTYDSSLIRSIALEIIFDLESASNKSIIEAYNFDMLIAMSLEQKPLSPQSKNDPEKLNAFKLVYLMLKKRYYLPSSVIRGLTSYYNICRPEEKQLIILYLKEAFIISDEVFDIPEVSEIFLESLINDPTNDQCDIICYSYEERHSSKCNSYLTLQLISEIFSSQKNDRKRLHNACKAITQILKKWPGFLGFGLENNGIQSIVRGISHEKENIISIFTSLIIRKDDQVSITDPYTGFVLYTFLQLGLVEKLPPNNSASALIHKLVPLDSKCEIINYPKVTVPPLENQKVKSRTLSMQIYRTKAASTKIDLKDHQWSSSSLDWNFIHIYLSVILPLNDADAQSQSSLQLYNMLFDFFANNFLHEDHPHVRIMTKCLESLLDLLLESSWGDSILESSNVFAGLLKTVMEVLLKDEQIPNDSPIWPLFNCITRLMSCENGVCALTKFNIIDQLTDLGTKCTNLQNCQKILPMMKFLPEPGWTILVYNGFLNSKDFNVSKLAITELRQKLDENPETKFYIFQKLLIPFVKSVYQENEMERLPILLNTLSDFLLKNEECIELISGDEEIHEILAKHCHFVYSIIFSSPESILHGNVTHEINWWMTYGNKEYVKIYDAAMNFTFSKDSKTISQYPSIINNGGFAMVPPHLFGHLSKFEKGVELLTNDIQTLLAICQNTSTSKTRAAFFAISHFASSPQADSIVQKFQIPEILIKTAISKSSYVIWGTLISCLSLFHISDYFSSVLQKYNWQLFKYGSHSAVIPCDVFSIVGKTNEQEILYDIIPCQISQEKKEIGNMLIELTNPITHKRAKENLISMIREKHDEIICPEVALYALKLLGNFSFPPESRAFIMCIFRQSPLMSNLGNDMSDQEIEDVVRAQCTEILQKNDSNEIPLSQVQFSKSPQSPQSLSSVHKNF